MYTEKDLADLNQQLKKRIRFLGLGMLVCILLCVGVFLLRLSVRTDIMGGHQSDYLFLYYLILVPAVFSFIFVWDLMIHPVRKYRDLVNTALHGRTRQYDYSFFKREQDEVLRQDIPMIPLTMCEGDSKDENNHRTLYYDARLPFPAWQEGELLHITVHDKLIVNWSNTNQTK